jgi:hypothetical protein
VELGNEGAKKQQQRRRQRETSAGAAAAAAAAAAQEKWGEVARTENQRLKLARGEGPLSAICRILITTIRFY